ncbi:Ribosomal protein S6--L-glutamate ligase [Pseudomonas fluorescens]|uniref:Ribosomal protein S6--L-glutamate ligase n=1 Tax=Pseudomonas fluorescens TaxID=294 RepID=A0A5E7SSA0_PSEFL|nr:ATP-grasp domain-containing protein [Pseudomonas fluorescens]VVP88974.1 Ribosomal protein S6--L-glutamate ligase [Pseudomonas fluorescens]
MAKNIGIIHDDMHPLLDKIAQRVIAQGSTVQFIHYSALTFGFGVADCLKGLDAIYLDRMGELTRSYSTQLALLPSLQKLSGDIPIINEPSHYTVARNKALTAQLFKERGVPAPETAIVYSLAQIDDLAGLQSQCKFVVKSILGCCADDVHLYPDDNNRAAITAMLARDGMAIMQKFVERKNRFIWRVDVVDGKVIVCNQRFAYNPDDELPICNGTRGGEIVFLSPDNLPEHIYNLAVGAVQTLGLVVAGVDLVEADNGEIYVIEVNPEPDITLDKYELPYSIADYLIKL